VLVHGDKIVAIAPVAKLKATPGATVVDGSGKFLMPGLVDFHTHPRSDTELAAFRHYGVTRIVALGGEPLGWSAQARAALEQGLPHVMAATRPVDGADPISPRFYSLADPDLVAGALASEQARGAGMVKVYSKLSVPVLQQVARDAHKLGMPVIGHTPWYSKPEEVLNGQIDIVAHGEELFQYLGDNPSDAKIEEIITRMHQHGVALVPNMVAYRDMGLHAYHIKDMLQDEQAGWMSATSYQDWQPRNDSYANRDDLAQFDARLATGMGMLKRITFAAQRAGVPLLAGTDAPAIGFAGSSLLDEVDFMAQSGLSNYQALRSVTVNAGQVLVRFPHLPSNFGMVKTGQQADLLLLAANPLQDLSALRKPQGVMVGGHWYSPEKLAQEDAAARAQAQKAQQVVLHYEELATRGQYDQLIASVQALPVGRFPDLHPAVVSGDVAKLADAGNVKQALALLQAAQPHLSSSAAYYKLQGDLQRRLGEREAARASYRQALAMMPGYALALEAVAKLDAEQTLAAGNK
jgi:imidazolonepropionase-like amidohydrolase